jgi:hypothetical protein
LACPYSYDADNFADLCADLLADRPGSSRPAATSPLGWQTRSACLKQKGDFVLPLINFKRSGSEFHSDAHQTAPSLVVAHGLAFGEPQRALTRIGEPQNKPEDREWVVKEMFQEMLADRAPGATSH